jgi:hypothetical protein
MVVELITKKKKWGYVWTMIEATVMVTSCSLRTHPPCTKDEEKKFIYIRNKNGSSALASRVPPRGKARRHSLRSLLLAEKLVVARFAHSSSRRARRRSLHSLLLAQSSSSLASLAPPRRRAGLAAILVFHVSICVPGGSY